MSQRIQKIKDTYSQQFRERLDQENVDISLDSAWDILISADPSQNRKNVRWLVDTYINNGYLWEDIVLGVASKVAETLTEFDKHKRNLSPSERSLMKYQTIGELWSVIKPYVGQLTANEEKREERDKAYAEAEVVVDREDGLKIVVPKTEFAAKWFGRGTRWCTSAENNNMFYNYAILSPLFIIIMPDGNKLQLWKNSRSIQFMDENDENVSKDYIEKNWEILGNVVLNLERMAFIPGKYLEPDVFLNICIKDPSVLKDHMPSSDKDLFFNELLKHNPNAIKYIPDRYKTQEMYNIIIEKEPRLFYNVPDECITPEMALFAVTKDSFNIAHVPEYMRTQEMYNIVVRQSEKSFTYLNNKEKTYEVCLEAVKHYGLVIQYIPMKLRTEELCREAIKQDGIAVQFVPPEVRTVELCRLAVQQNPTMFRYLPKEEITREICEKAVQINNIYYQSVPEEFLDNEFNEKYIRNKGSLSFMKKSDQTKELCDLALKNNIREFRNIDKKYKTPELCEKLVKQDGYNLRYVPEKLRTPELCLEAIKKSPSTIRDTYFSMQTEEICELAVSANPYNIQFVDEKHKTEKLYKIVLQQEGSFLSSIRKDDITIELAKIAVQQDRNHIKYVPKDMLNEIEEYIRNMNIAVPPQILKDKQYTESIKQIQEIFSSTVPSLTM